MYKKIHSEFSGILTGKSLTLGGSLIRPEATGYGMVYFAARMLETRNQTLEGKTCLISGSGNVAQHAAEKLIESGAKILTLSDSSGYIYDEEGIDAGKLDYIKAPEKISGGGGSKSMSTNIPKPFMWSTMPTWIISPCGRFRPTARFPVPPRMNSMPEMHKIL